MTSIKIVAPATVANLVCGFDVLGMALNDPQDSMELRISDVPGIRIKHIDGYDLPTEPAKNRATPLQFPPNWKHRMSEMSGKTLSIIGAPPPSTKRPPQTG